jgi:hypothetical protein
MDVRTVRTQIQEGAKRCAPPTVNMLSLAAFLCYFDAATDQTIADRLGISRRTLARWKRRPEFVAASVSAALYADLLRVLKGSYSFTGIGSIFSRDELALVKRWVAL